MKNKRTKQIKKINKTLEVQKEIIRDTHIKIEIGDEQLYNMIEKQQKIIDALITILIQNKIIKNKKEIQDIIDSKEVMEKITQKELTEEEIKKLLQEEANILYKLLYRNEEK